jgi:hypothetical protein
MERTVRGLVVSLTARQASRSDLETKLSHAHDSQGPMEILRMPIFAVNILSIQVRISEANAARRHQAAIGPGLVEMLIFHFHQEF